LKTGDAITRAKKKPMKPVPDFAKPRMNRRCCVRFRFYQVFIGPMPKTISFWFGLALAVLPASTVCGQTWMQTSAPDADWHGVSSSGDGTRLVAVVRGGPIFVSSDSGATWTATAAPTANWFATACSVDGSRLIATSWDRAYISADAGLTWSQATNAPANTVYLTSVTSSAEGRRLAIGYYDGVHGFGGLARSMDFGATWTDDGPRTVCLAGSADGTTLLAGTPGSYLLSTNAGASWTDTTVPCSWVGGAAACSANGRQLVVLSTDDSGLDYTSNDGGLTWATNTVPAGEWIAVASSADGTRLVAAQGGCWNPGGPGCGGPVYTSTDGGATWLSNNVPPAFAVACSADGGKLVAVVSGGGIWVSRSIVAPRLKIASLHGGAAVSWLLPSSGFVLQQRSDFTVGDWSDVTNGPTLNLANLENEVILPFPGGAHFYRLRQ
jgi:hypothetical protein